MQAPILSFDEEGDIPLPATKHKRMLNYMIKIIFQVFIFINIGFRSPDNVDSRDNISTSKSGGDSISIERTRKERFRHALRTVSKVAFSQLGLGNIH